MYLFIGPGIHIMDNSYINTIIIIITSSDDIQSSTLITDQSPSGLLLDIKAQNMFKS